MNYLSRALLVNLAVACNSAWSAGSSTQHISASDLQLDQSGGVVTIDPNGTELYLNYKGTDRQPTTVNISAGDSKSKIVGGKCNIAAKDSRCKYVLKYVSYKKPSYTDQTIKVTDAAGVPIADYTIWVKPVVSPWPVQWRARGGKGRRGGGPLIIQNANVVQRKYKIDIDLVRFANSTNSNGYEPASTYAFNLPAKSICYVDYNLVQGMVQGSDYIFATPMQGWGMNRKISDITDSNNVSYNSPYITGNNNISSCSTEGVFECSNRWGSWSVGLMNISGKQLGDYVDGSEQTRRTDTWNSGDTIYYEDSWSSNSNNGTDTVALIAINASTDGSTFDPSQHILPKAAVVTAPPCSSFKE